MIQSFGDKITKDIFDGISNKKTIMYKNILPIIIRKLDMINATSNINDLIDLCLKSSRKPV